MRASWKPVSLDYQTRGTAKLWRVFFAKRRLALGRMTLASPAGYSRRLGAIKRRDMCIGSGILALDTTSPRRGVENIRNISFGILEEDYCAPILWAREIHLEHDYRPFSVKSYTS